MRKLLEVFIVQHTDFSYRDFEVVVPLKLQPARGQRIKKKYIQIKMLDYSLI